MSDIQKEKEEDGNLTVSKVYETLKSGPFLKNMYWEVLSGLKNTNTFKQMKENMKKILESKLDALEHILFSDACSGVAEKTTLAEICSMSYTVDTVYSKVLYMKLKKEFKCSLIPNLIRELRNEGHIPDDVWNNLQISMDSQAEENNKVTNDSAKQKTESPTKSIPVSVKKGKEKVLCNGNKKLENNNHITRNNAENVTKISGNKKEIRNQTVQKSTSAACTSTPIKKAQGTSSVVTEQNSNSKKTEAEPEKANAFIDDDQDSDAESLISVGRVSLSSVSSVHTDDLSSFDDEVSLSEDEEEGAKKKMPLKEVISRISNVPTRIAEKLNGTSFMKSDILEKSSSNSALESSTVKISEGLADEATDTASDDPYVPNMLSKRIRKPNARYSSETVICHSMKVKERKKQPFSSLKSEDERNSSEFSPRKKAKTDTESVETMLRGKKEETSNKVQKTDNIKENTSSVIKSQSKRRESSDLFKPHSSLRSLTSRKTAPLTLFSTGP